MTPTAPRLWLGVADAWQRNLEQWLFTTNGPLGDGRYYVRIDDDGDPNDGSERDFGNAAGVHKENAVVDGGILEAVRLGVKAPNDPYIAESLPEIDASLATDTPSGRVWHRYTFDGYGEQPDGAPWTVQHARHQGARVAAAGRRARRVRARQRPRRPAVSADDGQHRQRRLHDPRAGLGRGAAGARALRLSARQGHRRRVAARVGDGPVRPPRPRDRGRQAGRDARASSATATRPAPPGRCPSSRSPPP